MYDFCFYILLCLFICSVNDKNFVFEIKMRSFYVEKYNVDII